MPHSNRYLDEALWAVTESAKDVQAAFRRRRPGPAGER